MLVGMGNAKAGSADRQDSATTGRRPAAVQSRADAGNRSEADAVAAADRAARTWQRGRIPRDLLRERVLAAAEKQLADGALSVGLHHLNMEELIRDAGVPRSSVFAAFGGKDELITELMLRSLRSEEPRPHGYSAATVAEGASILAAHADRLTGPDGAPDAAGRDAVLGEIVRVLVQHNMQTLRDSREWQTYVALSVSVRSLPEGRRERVAEALRDAESHFIDAMTVLYSTSLIALGRRPRGDLTFRHVATAGSSLVEGLATRILIGNDVADTRALLPGVDGDPVEWHLAALGVRAVIDGMTEQVP